MIMNNLHQPVLSIAGFDPTGGAGVLADIKTFEQLGIYGFGVITANTIQDEDNVYDIRWQPLVLILEQMDRLFRKHTIKYVKIGIIENDKTFSALKNHLVNYNPEIHIIWDPVLKSSSGYSIFNYGQSTQQLLENVFLVTPNLPEFQRLFKDENEAVSLSHLLNIYLKGGHDTAQPGDDHLFNAGEKSTIRGLTTNVHEKHGSGCVLSSAITAALAGGESLENACRKGKNYTERFLASHPSLLGFHNKKN